VFCVFEDWPHNYFSFLDWVKEQRNKDGIGKGLKRDFDPYRQSLYAPLNLDKLSFLREAFEEYLVTRWKGGYVSSIRTISTAALRNKHYASPSEAVETLKISHERFEYLVEQGTLQVEVPHRKDCKIILIDVSSLRRFKRLYDAARSLKDVVVLLGIPYNHAADLVSKKLLTPIFDPRVDPCNKWKFSRKELNNLANKIKKRIKRIDDSPKISFISFKWVLMKFSYFKLGLGQLVSAISSGELTAYCKKDETRLSSLLYSRAEVTSYLRAQRQKCTGETFDAYELSQYLRVSKDVVYFLVKRGLLMRQEIVHEGFIDLLVTKTELERFESTYIFGPKLARGLNVGCQFLVDSLSARDIHPITGRKVDGGMTCIFKRSDLIKVNVETIISEARTQSVNKYYPPELLSSEQTAAVLDVSKEELQDLIERGIIKPFASRKHQITRSSGQCFGRRVIERVKKRAFNYTGLISKQVAAAMLGETVRDFFDKYIYTGRLKRVRAEGERNTYYLHLEDVKAHVRLKEKLDGFKNKVMNSPEVAAIFGVRTSCVTAWTVSGKLKAVSGPRIDGMPHYLYLKET
jgi:hypothetical protein